MTSDAVVPNNRYGTPNHSSAVETAAPPDTNTADLLAVLKELMAWHDCLPTRNICDIQDDAKRLIAAAEVRS